MIRFRNRFLGASSGGGGIPSGTVVSLLHFDGANNGTVFTDEVNTQTWARRSDSGGSRTSTTAQKFGPTSLNVTLSYGIQASAVLPFEIGTNDFCVEMWIYATTTTAGWIFNKAAPAVGPALFNIGLVWNGSSGITAIATNNGLAEQVNIVSGVISLNTWHHVAFNRYSGLWKLYVDGVSVGTPVTNADSFTFTATNPCIGDSTGGGAFNNNFIDEFRYTIGSPVYTGNFTPPTSAFPNP